MDLFETFSLPFVQRGAWVLCLLGLAAGPIGTWIVLRGLAFFSHAVGTASFPGLVVAAGLAIPAWVGAGTAAVAFVVPALVFPRRVRLTYDSLTAVTLAGMLALGVILASDVFQSGAGVESLLFGSLLLVSGSDLTLTAAVAALVLGANYLVGWRWLRQAFEEEAEADRAGAGGRDGALLMILIALASVVALTIVGALMVSALLVVPAVTTRLFCRRLTSWQVATSALAIAEGLLTLWISVSANAPPGAAMATISGAVFALALVARPALGTR